MRGKIKAIFENEKNFGVSFNGTDWYTGYLSDKPDWLIKGESNGVEIEFEYKANKSGDRTYNNIVKDTLKIIPTESFEPPSELKPQATLEPPITEYNKKREEKDEQTRKEIRAAVAIKEGVMIMDKTATLQTWEDSEENKEKIIKRVIFFAERIYDWLKMKSEQNFP